MIHRFATSLMGKLVVLFVSVAMALIAVVGFFSYSSARSALEDAQFEKLDFMRDTQARYVKTYVADILDQLRLMLKNPNLRASLISLSWSYDADEATAKPQDKPTQDSSDKQPKIFGSKGTYDILDKKLLGSSRGPFV